MTGPLDIQRALASLNRRPRPAPRKDGLRRSRTCRATGTTVEVYDLNAPHPFIQRGDDPYREHRWLTLCVDHGRLCTHPTIALAYSHATQPSGWCGVCDGTEPPDED